MGRVDGKHYQVFYPDDDDSEELREYEFDEVEIEEKDLALKASDTQ